VITHKTVDNKAPDQILPYSDNTLFRNKAANLGHSRAAQPNCSEAKLLCTGRFVSSAPYGIIWIKGSIKLIPLFKFLDSQGTDVTNRPVQNSKTACVILISFFNKRVFGAVWLSSLRVTQICCLISEKRVVRIWQNLVRSVVIDCFMGAHDGFTK